MGVTVLVVDVMKISRWMGSDAMLGINIFFFVNKITEDWR